MDKPFLVIGHRGACGHEPENTLRSFEKAIELGADAIELDVHVCKTGELVVMHNFTVGQTTNGHGRIVDLTLDELRRLDAGKGERIPTLAEAIDLVNGRVPINIELKTHDAAQPVAELIEHYYGRGWDADRFTVSSFDHFALDLFRSLQPITRIGALIAHLPLTTEFAVQLGASSVNCRLEFINRMLIADARSRGLKVLVYTVNDEPDIEAMFTAGADGIFTNYPDRALRIVGR